MKNSLGRKIALFFVPLLGAWFVRMWFLTCRVRVHNREHQEAAENTGCSVIRTSWHHCILGLFAIYLRDPFVLMISASRDGEYLAKMTERLGFSVVRGSSNYRGAQAAIEMIRELRRGRNGGLVADGSQGPAMVAQAGPLLLAAKSGGVVLPMMYSATNYLVFNTWDRMILPLPFSRIDFFYGEMLKIPGNVKAGQLENYRRKLERRLNDLYEQVWQLQGKKKH